MSPKRGLSPQLVGNPFIKKENLEWTFDLSRPTRDSGEEGSSDEIGNYGSEVEEEEPRASAVEAGKAKIEDHLGYFSGLLTKTILSPFPSDIPGLSIGAYRKL
ncbi:hypothetical protein F4813DRAFT_71364 [Daldinia decipiens]|uniref:uncharacterized protein n=1 Tax=Daldinia decipiens TaxID=326647 RepID=UPI0020C33277|nr:uncharacterized protein F4813DRAFT_71364 [Daldinia decipiens]KAI1657656.1 hypothetical protein F4813DRAFT_71364 [Daldinia decipiens]